MPHSEVVPPPALRPFVDRFWVQTPPGGGPRHILPDGCIDLLLNLGRGTASAVGTMTRAQVVGTGARFPVVAVRFRPGGATPFLGLDAHLLTDRVADGADLGLRWLRGLADRPTAAAALDGLARALLLRLSSVEAPDPLVAHAVGALYGPAPPTVDALAREVGCSRQHLARALRRHVGVGGKTLARVARLQRAVDQLLAHPRAGLAATAAAHGYFDQAHMTRDFRELAGLAPAQLRAAPPGSIFPIRSLLERG
jgi:AraC-like DNA-binding protein